MLSRISNWLNRVSEVVCCLVLLAMTLVVTLQVVCRYLLGASLTWSEEFARYGLVWLTFLGGAIALKKKAHMGFQALVNILASKVQSWVETLTLIGILGFLSIATLKGFQLAIFNMTQHSPAMGVPMGVVYFAIPTGSVLMLVHVLEHFTTVFRNLVAREPGRDS